MSCGPTYGQFVAWLHAAGLLPPAPAPGSSLTVTSGTGNTAGAAITTGKLVYLAGWDDVNGCPMVALADYADLATCATYLTSGTVPAGLVASSTGTVVKQGTITGLALVAAIGDPAYLSTTLGGVQAGTTGLTSANVCQQVVGHFVTAGTSVYVDLSAAPVAVLGTSELQAKAVTSAKADLTANWNWTGMGPQITLGQNGTAGELRIHESGTHHYTLTPAALTGNVTYTIPNAGGAATFILSQGTTALSMTGTAPQITLGDGAGVSGTLRLNDGTAAVRHADLTQATLAANRTYTLPDAGGNATFILSQGTTAMTNTAASPQVTLGSSAVLGGLALGDGSSANLGTMAVTTLTGARTFTMPDATGNVGVLLKSVALGGSTTNNSTKANIIFGNVQMNSGSSTCTVTLNAAVPNTNAASGSVALVTMAAPAGAINAAATTFGATISANVLTITLRLNSTGLATNAGSNIILNYAVMF